MAIRLGIALGGTPIGAPIIGWVADHFGPRWSLGVAAASGMIATAVGVHYLINSRRAEPHISGNAAEVSASGEVIR
jgi:MFS family permease